MPDWNPNSTATKGLEWAPHTTVDSSIASSAAAAVARVLSLADEFVGAVEVYCPSVTTSGKYAIDVIPSGSEVPSDTTYSSFAPNEDVTDSGITGVDNNTAGTLYTNLVTLGDDEYLRGDGTTSATPYFEGRVATGLGNFAGKRILAVTLRWVAMNFGTAAKTDTGSGLVIGGTAYTTSTADVTTAGAIPRENEADPDDAGSWIDSPPTVEHYATWYYNPATNAPWTVEDVESFDTTNAFRLQLTQTAATITSASFGYCRMEVHYCTENRVATGATTISSSGWNDIPVLTPQGRPWRKANATRYTYVLRRLSTTGNITARVLYGESDPPISADTYSGATLNVYGLVTSLGTLQTARVAPLNIKGLGYADLPGGANSYVSAPDSSGLSITSDLTLLALVSLDDWTPAATNTILAKWNTTGNQRAYAMQVTTGGNLQLILSTAGSAAITKTSTATLGSVGAVDGSPLWVGATFDANNGAAGYDVRFWYSTDGITWTQLGSTVTTATAITLFDSTALFEVGAHSGGASERMDGKVYYAEVRNSIGASGTIATLETTGFANTIKARFAPSTRTTSTASWSDLYATNYGGTGNTYTVQAGASIVGYNTSTDLADSQPYVTLTSAAVYTGQDAEGEFSDAAAVAYGVVQAMVRYSGTPTADLLVKVKRRSDNTQFGGTYTITKALVDAATALGADGWASLTGFLSSTGTLAAATQYYVEFSSSTDSSNPWYVLALNAADNAETLTFGGITDAATINGAEDTTYDLVATLSTVPTAPAGLASSLLWQSIDPGGAGGCAVTSIAYVHLAWTATALGVSFLRYEVQRTEDGGSTWNDVGLINTEATVTFDDYECARGVNVQHRIRVVRIDGAASDWTAATVGRTCPTVGVEWLFVSNQDPTLNCAYNREPTVEYEFLTAEETTFLALYGRDNQVALKPTENRGVAFELALILSAVSTPAARGLPVFAPLRAIGEDPDISYVCVLDPDGNRWLAEVQVPQGTHANPGQRYVAMATVTEISSTFSTPPDG